MSHEPRIEELFLGEPTRDLDDWAWLWTGDHAFPVHSHRGGILGRGLVFLKRLLRPLLKALLADQWDRQRLFNLILIEKLADARSQRDHLEALVSQLSRQAQNQDAAQRTLQGAIEDHAGLIEQLDRRVAGSMTDVMRHNDALFSRVDQKLDRYRREAKDLWHRLGALIAAGTSETDSGEAVSEEAVRSAQQEQEYLELERRYRGSEEEIERRIAPYLPYLRDVPGDVLDLGCGRGEALDVLRRESIPARGVDASGEMVARCREKGLVTEEADLFEHLLGLDEAELGAVVSFHVIEHLPAEAVERLVRLAWKALKPGGILALETPSPLSIAMASRDFWIDPTHKRPVHPASLEITFREAGFEPVHRLDLQPFSDRERLPEIDLARLPEEQKALADHVNRLRDLLDDLLFGYRDFGMIGVKP